MFEHSGSKLKSLINFFFIFLCLLFGLFFVYLFFTLIAKGSTGEALLVLLCAAIIFFVNYTLRLWMYVYAENAEANVMSQEEIQSIYEVLTRIEHKLDKKTSISPEVHDVEKNIKDALKF